MNFWKIFASLVSLFILARQSLFVCGDLVLYEEFDFLATEFLRALIFDIVLVLLHKMKLPFSNPFVKL